MTGEKKLSSMQKGVSVPSMNSGRPKNILRLMQNVTKTLTFLNHNEFSSAFTFPKIPLANHTTIKILFKYQTVLHFPQRATQDWRLSMKYSMDAYHMKHSPWANLLRLRLD